MARSGGTVEWFRCPRCGCGISRRSLEVLGFTGVTKASAEAFLLSECPERDYAAEAATEQLGRDQS